MLGGCVYGGVAKVARRERGVRGVADRGDIGEDASVFAEKVKGMRVAGDE